MRDLKFIVNCQTLQKDPACDFSGLTPGSKGYLRCEFELSEEWEGATAAASFMCRGKEIGAALVQNGACMVPDEAAGKPYFSVSLIGIAGKQKIVTNKVLIRQEG